MSIEAIKTVGRPDLDNAEFGRVLDAMLSDPVARISELVEGRDPGYMQTRVAAALAVLMYRQAAPSVGVVEYGAIGDGVTDDTAAIQAAVDAVSAAGGGEVLLAPGVFLVSETITLATGVTLRGSGVPSTTILGDDMDGPIIGTTVSDWIASPTVRAPQVHDLLISNQSRDTAGGIALDISGCANAIISNVSIQQVETGLRVTNSTYWSIFIGVRIATVDNGIVVTQNANHNTFYGCVVLASDVGVHVVEGEDAGVSNTHFSHLSVEQFLGGSNEYGIHVETTTASAVDVVTFTSPRIENGTSGGTGIVRTGAVRSLAVTEPQFVNIATPVSGMGEDTIIRWRGQQKQGTRVGVFNDYTTQSHARLSFDGTRLEVRNNGGGTYVGVRAAHFMLTNGRQWLSGSGSPEGSVGASPGSLYTDEDGGAGVTLYVKEGGSTGSTGWVAK